jgi:hypothetical protein
MAINGGHHGPIVQPAINVSPTYSLAKLVEAYREGIDDVRR